jgi:hypothetical protein
MELSYFENRKDYGKYALDRKCVFYLSLQLLFETFFAAINIEIVTLEMCAEMNVRLRVKFSLLFFDIN